MVIDYIFVHFLHNIWICVFKKQMNLNNIVSSELLYNRPKLEVSQRSLLENK